jgi:hypothetical protein
MASDTSRTLAVRRALLLVAAAVFAGIAIGSLVAPDAMAKGFDYSLSTPNALSEFRAIYVGLWLAHVVLLAWAAKRIELLYLGDIAALLILGQVAGRLVSVVLDGLPDMRLVPIAAAELLGGIFILTVRPGKSLRGAPRAGPGTPP